ncbi:MAG: PHP domain-containing protein [Candidatus Zipacnadales bacterium]
MSVDLHIHSTASDGTLSPEEIVSEALRIGLTAIAIADHDELEGSREAVALGQMNGLSVIPAVEISTDYEKVEVHILGYWIDLADEWLARQLASVREARVWRAQQIVDRLRTLGIDQVTLDDVLREAGRGSIGRPHVAAALVRAGVCQAPQEAYRKYLKKGAPAYVPRVRPSTVEAIHIIKKAGGCSVLAHPGLVPRKPHIIAEMAAFGVEGVEVYHSKHNDDQMKTFLDQAHRQGLLVTGGSDSHGPGGSYPVPIGSGDVPDSCAEALYEWRSQRES